MARPGDAPWRGLYEHERDGLLLARLRWCTALTAASGLGIAISALAAHPSDWQAHLFASGCFAAVSAPVGAATRFAWAQRAASALGVAYLLGLTAVLVLITPVLPGLIGLAPALLIAIMLGTTLLLPWGTRSQAVVGLGALIAFAAVARDGAVTPLLSATYLVVSAAAVSVVGARLVDQYRAASFEQTWAQEQLAATARALTAHVDADAVAAALADHASRLVPASSVVVALRDARRGIVRVVADTSGTETVRGLEVPDSLEPVVGLLAGPLHCLPDDDPASPINGLLEQHGVRRVLYASLRHGGEGIGVVAFVRKTAAPFGDTERRIVRGLAEQASLALATAGLVADLRAANQLKTDFVSTMSHELRTPLNVILGHADMLEDDGFTAAERREFVERIRVAGRDLLDLIENTLAIGRLEAGRDELRIDNVWLPTLWQTLGERCARMPRRADVVLVWSEAPATALRTDQHKLQVIVANLVSNALKFTERGRVQATVATAGDDGIVLHVADTGIGIRAEDQPHVFEMFRQVDASDSRRYGGTGLGLYIVQRFAAQIGATVTLESHPGHGSTFTVHIPATPASAAMRTAA